MPVDLELISFLERKFSEADMRRSAGLEKVHDKVGELTQQIVRIDERLTTHITGTSKKFQAIDDGEAKAADRKDGWGRTVATLVFGGGVIKLYEWFKEKL